MDQPSTRLACFGGMMDGFPVNARVFVNGVECEATGVETVEVCACCSYRASERGEWPRQLPVVADGETRELECPAAPGTGAVRLVEVAPGLLWLAACEACADQQCNGCYRCATHCSCPPGTGRPAWILPTAEEVAAMPPLEGPFATATVDGDQP